MKHPMRLAVSRHLQTELNVLMEKNCFREIDQLVIVTDLGFDHQFRRIGVVETDEIQEILIDPFDDRVLVE